MSDISRENFQNLVKEYLKEAGRGGTKLLADTFLVSTSTIRRWTEGHNLPGEKARVRLAGFLKSALRDRKAELRNPMTNEPTTDEVTSAVMEMYGALVMCDGEQFTSFPDLVKRALDRFNQPRIRTSLARRLYHPELYVKKEEKK